MPKENADKTKATAHPMSEGLEASISSCVEKELKKRGIGGNGGSDDTDARLNALEKDVAIIKETMVTKEMFYKEFGGLRSEFGDLKAEMSKIPFETFKWLLATILAVFMLVFASAKFLPMIFDSNNSTPASQSTPAPTETTPKPQS